jgi:hypothetical protein
MGWFAWWRRNGAGESWIRQWETDWKAAVDRPEAAAAAALRARLEAAGLDDERLEIEREMLEGLEAVIELETAVAERGPETIVTGHRAVGADLCYFSAPVSVPDDPAQPSGTLLLTNVRALFVGGPRAVTIPWHAVGRSFPQHRDLVLVRSDREDLHRFRCNSFADAMRAAFLSRHLSRRRV